MNNASSIIHRPVTWLIALLILTAGQSAAQSVEYDKRLGRENAEKIALTIGLYDHPELTNYVEEVGQKLVRAFGPQPFDFSFHVIDSEEPNAFALPGGYIYITRGLLMITNNEDELACVLAHEIIHAINRHGVKSQKRGLWTSLILLPASILGAVGGPEMQKVMSIPLAGGELFNASYSRGHEKEADKLGVQLAERAGYNPFALADILGRLSSTVEVITGEAEQFSYFDSHPFTEKRERYITDAAEKATGVKRISSDPQMVYLHKLDGMVIGQNPKGGIIENTCFSHPDLDLRFDFPSGWTLSNAPAGVTGMQEEGEAVVFFTFETDSLQAPERLGAFYAEKLGKQSSVQILKNEDASIAGMPAHYLAFLDRSQPYVHYHLCWVQDDTITYRFTGIGKDSQIENIKSVFLSFRKLDPEEKEAFAYKKLRTVTAHEGEQLGQLLDREANQLPLPLTAVINGLSGDAVFTRQQPVKTVTRVSYWQ